MKIQDGDVPWDTETITAVRPYDEGWDISMGGSGILVPNDLCDVPPAIGETVEFYGRGFGYDVRGIVIEGRIYRYLTEEEAEVARKEMLERERRKKDAAWEEGKEAFMDRVEALPPEFRKRVAWFMAGNERWGAEFGPYELFCCEQAVVIAADCREKGDVDSFHEDRDRQERVLGEAMHEHSGNTFGASCMLASLYLSSPEMVWKGHAAIHGITGCAAAGCFAARQQEGLYWDLGYSADE